MERGSIEIICGRELAANLFGIERALTAIPADAPIYMGRFTGGRCSLTKQRFPHLTVERYRVHTARSLPDGHIEQATRAALYGYEKAYYALTSGHFDLVIAEEITTMIEEGLLAVEQVLHLMEMKPLRVRLLLTGSIVPPVLREAADIVSEISHTQQPHTTAGFGR